MHGLKEVALSFSKAPSSVFYHVYHKREGLGAHINTLHGQSYRTGPVTSKPVPGSSDPGTSGWHMKYSKPVPGSSDPGTSGWHMKYSMVCLHSLTEQVYSLLSFP